MKKKTYLSLLQKRTNEMCGLLKENTNHILIS